MKRVGYIYEQMAVWENIVEAEKVSTKRKAANFGVKRHKETRWQNLCEIQQHVLNRTMRTGEYKHEMRVSGQDKMRDIAKLHFHPSHIQHQLLTLVAERRIDRALIRHTYASRKGYGQTAAALQIRNYLRKHRNNELWYAQGDICKYYDNIPHKLLRQNLESLFKDKEFVDAFLEPFERFSDTGKSIPLGIRPSQQAGNICLMKFDRYATECVKCEGYVRYLDDFVFFGYSKGEVKRKMKQLKSFVEQCGFKLHEPKIHRVREGLDMLGFVYYNTRNDMFWRKSDKRRWLKRRSGVTNKRRLRELDDAAWGMLKWGNSHCKRLFHKKTGERRTFAKMGVSFKKSGIHSSPRVDSKGVPFIEAPKASMTMICGKPIIVLDVVKGITTSHGGGRYALKILFMGDEYKFIANASAIKTFCDDMEKNHVTKFKTVFYDRGGMKYDVDFDKTEILEIDGRAIEESEEGKIIFSDTKEEVQINNN